MFRGKQSGCLCFIRTAEAGSKRGGGGGAGCCVQPAWINRSIQADTWRDKWWCCQVSRSCVRQCWLDVWRLLYNYYYCVFLQKVWLIVNKLFTKQRNRCLLNIRISWTASIRIVLLYCGVSPPTTTTRALGIWVAFPCKRKQTHTHSPKNVL